MVAHFTMRTHGVNQAFRFVEGIWLHRESHQMRFFHRKKTFFYIIRAQHEMSNHLIQKPCLSLLILNRGVLMDFLQKGFSTSKEVALTNLAWCRIETENDKSLKFMLLIPDCLYWILCVQEVLTHFM